MPLRYLLSQWRVLEIDVNRTGAFALDTLGRDEEPDEDLGNEEDDSSSEHSFVMGGRPFQDIYPEDEGDSDDEREEGSQI